jgi:hypothetical protein
VKAARARSGLGPAHSPYGDVGLHPSNIDSSVNDRNRYAGRISGVSILGCLNPCVQLNPNWPFPTSRHRLRRKQSRQRVVCGPGRCEHACFISIEPSSLATTLYAVQELIAVLVLVAILVAITTAFLAIAVLLQEAGRSGIRWGKRPPHRHRVPGNQQLARN